MAGLFGAATPVIAAESKLDDAVAFGALEAVEAASLSVDGRKLIYVGADTDDRAIAVLVDLTSWNSRKVAFADGRKVQFSGCDWSANDRVVCTLFGVQREMGVIMPLVRTVAMDADGKNQVFLGQRDTLSQYGKRQVDGEVVDWLNGRDGMVQHAAGFAAAGIPFIFDPGQGLPMFGGEDLKTFIEQASWVAVNVMAPLPAAV